MFSVLVSTTSDTTDGFVVLGSWAGLVVSPAPLPTGLVVTPEPSPHRLCSLPLSRPLPPSLFPPVSVSGTAFTERWWGCPKLGEHAWGGCWGARLGRTLGSTPGEDAWGAHLGRTPGEHAWGSAQGGCAWDPEGCSGLCAWPSQHELLAGPVWSPGKQGPCHTRPVIAPGGLTPPRPGQHVRG